VRLRAGGQFVLVDGLASLHSRDREDALGISPAGMVTRRRGRRAAAQRPAPNSAHGSSMPSRRGNRHHRKQIGYRFLIVRRLLSIKSLSLFSFSGRFELVYRGLQAFEF